MDAGTIMSLVLSLAFVVFIIWFVYRSSKWLAKRNIGLTTSGRYINIIDRVAVGQDKYILMLKTGSKHLLVGISNNSVQILTELDESDITEIKVNPPKVDFQSILKGFNNLVKKSRNGFGS